MNTRFAHILSAVFHPLLMPSLLLGLLFFTVPTIMGVDVLSPGTRLTLLAFVATLTFVVPALLIYYLYRAGFVKSLRLETLSDRRLPYFLTAMVYGFSTYFFANKMGSLSELAPEIPVVLGSITVSILLVGIISFYWQISAHAVGISGVAGALAGIAFKYSEPLLLAPFAGAVILMGYLAGARLHLNAHTPAQIVAGIALGFIVSGLAVWWGV